MGFEIRPVTIGDYDSVYKLWNSTEQTRRAMNPGDSGQWETLARPNENTVTAF